MLSQKGGHDPFTGKGGRDFKATYLELWSKIIEECNAMQLTFNEYMIERLCNLLIGLSWCVLTTFDYKQDNPFGFIPLPPPILLHGCMGGQMYLKSMWKWKRLMGVSMP